MKEGSQAKTLSSRHLWRVAGAAYISLPLKDRQGRSSRGGSVRLVKPRKVVFVERIKLGKQKRLGWPTDRQGRGLPSSEPERPSLYRKREYDDDLEMCVEAKGVPSEPSERSDPQHDSTDGNVTADFHSLFKRKRALRDLGAEARHVRVTRVCASDEQCASAL